MIMKELLFFKHQMAKGPKVQVSKRSNVKSFIVDKIQILLFVDQSETVRMKPPPPFPRGIHQK